MAGRTRVKLGSLFVTGLSLAAGIGIVGLASPADADPLYCGPTQYFDGITVAHYPNGQFKIEATPKTSTRFALDVEGATIEEWHEIQACVPGLYGSLADSVWDQLKCHQSLAAAWPNKDELLAEGRLDWATGPTYDLESWRPTFSTDYDTYISTHCGNLLGTDPGTDPSYTAPPDAGQTDMTSYADIG